MNKLLDTDTDAGVVAAPTAVVTIVDRPEFFRSILVPYLRPPHRNYMFVDLFLTVNKN